MLFRSRYCMEVDTDVWCNSGWVNILLANEDARNSQVNSKFYILNDFRDTISFTIKFGKVRVPRYVTILFINFEFYIKYYKIVCNYSNDT